MAQLRNAFITINNHTEEEVNTIKNLDYKCLVIGYHVGEKSKLPHIHCGIWFKKRITFLKLKKIIPRANIARIKGSYAQLHTYCNKNEEVEVLGDVESVNRKKPCNIFHRMNNAISEGASAMEIKDSFPELWYRYKSNIEGSLISNIHGPNITLYEWEEKMVKIFKNKPHDRHIYWLYDEIGGCGKSTFAKWLVSNKGAFYCTNGKSQDIIYAYQGEKIFIMDLCRSNEMRVNYSVIESVKNGLMFSAKYAARMKAFDIPHMMILANFPPERNRLSEDRWVIVNIGGARG